MINPLFFKKQKIDASIISGVYFLFSGDVLKYVGSSRQIYSRVKHSAFTLQREYGIKIDSFSYLECLPEKMKFLEKEYIKHLKPEGNIHSNPSRKKRTWTWARSRRKLLPQEFQQSGHS